MFLGVRIDSVVPFVAGARGGMVALVVRFAGVMTS
jgi:hypothetical protein